MNSRLIAPSDLTVGGFNGLFDERASERGLLQELVPIIDATFTLPNDPNYAFMFDSSVPQVITIPANTSNWRPYNPITLFQKGVAPFTISVAPEVILRIPEGFTAESGGQYRIVQIVKVGSNEFWLSGDIKPEE